jgi:membrane associated rhomboid family serine protease
MNTPIYNYRPRPASNMPNVIFGLLIANGLAFVLEQLNPRFVLGNFALWPLNSELFAPWQILTYGFLHDRDSLWHIFFNMFALWMFGRDIERLMGPKRFLIYYLTCVVGAAVVQLVVARITGEIYPTIGASGGVFGVLLAFGLAFPNRMVMLIFPPIPMRAKYFVLFYGLLELTLGVTGAASGIAHFAHLGGMLFGFLLLRYWSNRNRRG